MESKLAFFKENGYSVEHGALTREEVATVVAAIDSIGGSSADVFHRTSALDLLAYHPNIYPFARRVLGEGARLSSFNYGNATPTDTPPPADPYGDGLGEDMVLNRAWHREDSGNVEGAMQNEYFCPAIQAIIYLDDVDSHSHCTSIIPESAETKRNLPKTRDPLLRDGRHHDGLLRIDDYGPFGTAGNFRGGRFHTSLEQGSYISKAQPTWVDSSGQEVARRVGGVDVYARAGSAVIFNNASFHCRTSRCTTKQRRTVRVRYRQPEPVESGHAVTDPYRDVAHFTAALPNRPALRGPAGEPTSAMLVPASQIPSAAKGDWRRPGVTREAPARL